VHLISAIRELLRDLEDRAGLGVNRRRLPWYGAEFV
jgi:hypothetical protein